MSVLLHSINFLFLVSICFLNTFVSLARHDLCHHDQRDALLRFKNEFEIIHSDYRYYPKTESWVNKSDCCSWDGITCDAKSGKVIELDLSDSCLYGRLESNSSLFRLRHLRDLNLANNNFSGSSIPAEFEKLVKLERLDLSESSFSGQIPTKILQLTKLVSLDLSYNDLSIDKSFLTILARNLRNLRELDMSLVNVSSEFPHEFSNMSSLRSLRLWDCNLLGEFPNSVLLMPNLQSFDLGENQNLRGSLPVFRENNSLLELSLSMTSFSGIIPESISNLEHLTSLDLYNNNFVGEIPSSFGNLKQLTLFEVRGNRLTGNLPSSLVNLTQLNYLGIDSNQFTGFLPSNISQLSKLEIFSARGNSFVGPIPSSIYKISSLRAIYLEDNKLSNLPRIENISLLPNLQVFMIGNNNYNVSPVDLNILSPLKNLNELSLSGIPLSTANFTYHSHFSPLFQYLKLSGCSITEFPQFIRNQTNLVYLDLSNNKIKGQVPDWLWRLQVLSNVNLSSNSFSGFNRSSQVFPGGQVRTVDLRSNAFQGTLFIPSTSIVVYFASKNNFSGEIPRSICGLSYLSILDLSNNNLHGSIPWCLGDNISSLSYLNLHNNQLSGSLPDIFTNAKELKSLDVSDNRLIGKLPKSLKACLSLEVLNVKSNNINDTFPFWLGSLKSLQVLVLSSNAFHGMLYHPNVVASWFSHLKIIDISNNDFTGTLKSDHFTSWKAMYSVGDDIQLKYLGDNRYYYDSIVLTSKGIEMEMERILTVYTAIDFSGNKFHGQIPESVGLLKDLHILNLSRNAFTGHIPSSLANLTALESLDISQNQLSGEIPPKLGDLSSLEWINVSHNQLVGPVPQGTQFHRQQCSSYEGNPGLYVSSLKDICGDINTPTSPESEPEEPKEDEEEEEWFSCTAAWIGLAPGVVLGVTMGYKQEWFMKTFGRNKHQRTRSR